MSPLHTLRNEVAERLVNTRKRARMFPIAVTVLERALCTCEGVIVLAAMGDSAAVLSGLEAVPTNMRSAAWHEAKREPVVGLELAGVT